MWNQSERMLFTLTALWYQLSLSNFDRSVILIAVTRCLLPKPCFLCWVWPPTRHRFFDLVVDQSKRAAWQLFPYLAAAVIMHYACGLCVFNQSAAGLLRVVWRESLRPFSCGISAALLTIVEICLYNSLDQVLTIGLAHHYPHYLWIAIVFWLYLAV